ncbi:alternative sulfate transporter [Eremomyces bilateralis CBS 781.70]|uniref:Alternative sulfate transporter n=1 Tax=Eremomyces bilateralis CBS 781.70 TaxID=1392243 RepID=A0A6G1G8U0_9PEZI|nr:alternative sulfate transporter [Eremomyces bilateralis CBS 781.70]KAF1814346.1 alternative sulfate transporter [Eremomyces bilateralis CBS 781.70]
MASPHSSEKMADKAETTVQAKTSSDGSHLSDPEHNEIVKDWSDEEERKVLRKTDLLLIPLLALCFACLQIDRGNIGNALTDFFLKDVDITQNQFNLGQQLMAACAVVLEIPSNMILYKVGPTLWIGSQIVAWGFVATFQAFQKGFGAFLVTRILLGLTESGFIPGALYSITSWYKSGELSKRFTLFWFGNMLANAFSGLIAYGILHMRGVAGLAGWQWLFIIEGTFTVLVGFLWFAIFPKSTKDPVSLLGFTVFNDRERHILVNRVLLDDPSKAIQRPHIEWSELKKALANWTVYPHLVLTISAIAPMAALTSYSPTIVASFGYGRLQANALVSIGSWCSMVVCIIWAWGADRTKVRGPFVFGGLLIYWGIVIGNRMLVHSKNSQARFAFLTLATIFSAPGHPVNASWVALNAGTAAQRAIAMALFMVSSNLSGVVGYQLFQKKDAPNYPVGWAVIIALVTFGLFCAAGANIQYWLLNGRVFRRNLRYKY